ncbi:MAG: general secretion pathway protein GspB, partial [Thiohalocapsa sp.]
MSYILEALKKSQQERELGVVPSLQAVSFDDRAASESPHRWVYVALLLAGVAVAIALFAVLRADPFGSGSAMVASTTEVDSLPGVPSTRVSAPPSSNAEVSMAVGRADLETVAGPAGQPAIQPRPQEPRTEPTSASQARSQERAGERVAVVPKLPFPDPPERPAPEARPLPAPESISVQPEVLVVPAPPKPGEQLPRGADELRRAVLGPGSSPSIQKPLASAVTPDLAPTDYNPARAPMPEHAPVPADLIADIEAFKKQVGASPAVAGVSPKPTPPPPSPIKPKVVADTALPPPPSTELRGKLPEFRMSVHIFDVDPARRFVYINGRKLRETEKTRDGLRLERVVADGAVL